ncbi:MAG: hypothetical protein JXP72_08755 [Coriobacteriia bacterium]|nr:hypothetical protein [Coriobacteriia bacterium]
MFYRAILRNAQFFELLLRIDRETAERVRAGRCPRCGGPLHAGHFRRKPRGIGVAAEELPDGFDVRFDLCCGRCRRRTLPESVRFLARRVYVGVAVAIATIVVRGPDRGAMRILREQLGVSRVTVARWSHWWRELVGSAFWQRLRGLVPPVVASRELPGALLEVFSGDLAERLLRLLRLLGPLTGSVPVTVARRR